MSDELVDEVCRLSPTSATLAGVRGFDHLWDDFSPDGNAARAAVVRSFLARVNSLPGEGSYHEALAARVLREYLEERLEFYGSEDPFLDLNGITSTFQIIPMVFDFADPSSMESLESIASRLNALPSACDGYRRLLQEGKRSGRLVGRRQVLAAIQQGRVQAGTASRYLALHETCARSGAITPALLANIERGARLAHEAVAALTDWLERDYLPAASTREGVGREPYARCARRHLGAQLDPEEAYAWGWEEIRRIEADMECLAHEIQAGASVREVIAALSKDPAQQIALPEPFLDLMRERQERAVSLLQGRHFDVPEPLRKVDVKLAPPGGKPGAYYCPPSEDFSRAGSIWYSPGSRRTMTLWQEVSTAYHEGFPGHHLQCSMQLWLADRLTRFQRVFASWSGYAEGWALYAEQLMFELGFLEHPALVLGMQAAQLARACRVVVDIGLHLDLAIPSSASFHPGERWSFALAVEMMRDRAFLEEELAQSEVVRYLGWPAQALSYKLGQRVLLQLREERRQREGASFDLRRFNADVVGCGAVGLSTLRSVVLG